MADVKPRAGLPPKLAEELNETRICLGAPHVAERLWNGALSTDECRGLRNNDGPVKIIQYVAKMRGCSFERAMLDVARDASVIDDGRRTRLLRRLGEAPENADDQPRPRWDARLGRLEYRGAAVRGKVAASAKNVRCILDAFEAKNWPCFIDNPLPGEVNSKRLRDALTRLNQSLAGIRFFAADSACVVLWRKS